MRELLIHFLIYMGISILVWGLAFLFWYLEKRAKRKNDEIRKTCNVKVTAVVVRMQRQRLMRNDDSSYIWVPTYQYYVGKNQTEKIEVNGKYGNGKKLFKEGQKVTLYYNPNQPKEIFVPDEANYQVKVFRIMRIGYIISGFLPYILFVIFDFILKI